jgi:hypothetical protein
VEGVLGMGPLALIRIKVKLVDVAMVIRLSRFFSTLGRTVPLLLP